MSESEPIQMEKDVAAEIPNGSAPECENSLLEPAVEISTVDNEKQDLSAMDNEEQEISTVGNEEQTKDSFLEPTVEISTEDNEEQAEDSLLEPAVEISTEDNEEQTEDNFFPFESLSVEINEGLEGCDNGNLENQEDVQNILENAGNAQENIATKVSSPEEQLETTHEYSNLSDEAYNGGTVADSTVPESNESSQDATTYEEEESVDPQELQETNLEDFIYSGTPTNIDEGSNSSTEESKEDRRYPLSRFPRVVKALQNAEYETLQILYQLLYQRSAWDTEEILKQRILEFSGFSFNSNSEEYFNRDMMLKTQPNEVLINIGEVLGLDHIQKMVVDGDKARCDLIAAIMNFLTVMRHLSRRKPKLGIEFSNKRSSTPTHITRCGCRNGCLDKTTEVQQKALLQYLKELGRKNLLDSYLFNLIGVTKHFKKSEDCKKLREVAYQYKVKMGAKEFVVCKGAYAMYHGLKRGKVVQLQTRLKTGTNIPRKIDLKDFPEFDVPGIPKKASPIKSLTETDLNSDALPSPESDNLEDAPSIYPDIGEELKGNIMNQKVSVVVEKLGPGFEEDLKYNVLPRRKAWERDDMVKALKSVKSGEWSVGNACRAFNVPRSTLKRYIAELGNAVIEDYVDLKVGQRPASMQSSIEAKIYEEKNVTDTNPVLEKFIPRQKTWEREDMIKALNDVKGGDSLGNACRTYNIPRSTLKRYLSELGDFSIEEYVNFKVGQRPFIKKQQSIGKKLNDVQKKIAVTDTPEKTNENKKDSTKESPKKNGSESKVLKDFPLVVTAIENASKELLIDVHFLLFLNSAKDDEVKENILNFKGFSFDSETEEYDERNEFLQRMSFKIVGDVARSFSLEILEKKEDTIKNILTFLESPNESHLRVESSMPFSLSDVELDDIEGFSDSDESITCEVVEKKVECIDLISSGEDSDDDKTKKVKKKKVLSPITKSTVNIPATKVPQSSTLHSALTNSPSVPAAPANIKTQQSSETDSQSSTQSGQRRLRDFETICKIVNTHPHEYLIDIFDLLYLRKHDPLTLRKDILDFSGFTFEKGSPHYVKRKQLLDRMLYNSVRRIYNTLIHNTTEVKVFSKPTMITEIFQFLFKLPDHDTSRPLQSIKPMPVKPALLNTMKATPPGSVAAQGPPTANQSAKLSDLKRVFQRVACFPCEYLIDVHKLLFMTDCDPKVIRQNIFAFKGFEFGPESQDFQQRKMYLEYLTFHSLRKISSVLTTRSVDLRNSTKHELASHLTQVLAEYCNTHCEAEIPEIHLNNQNSQNVNVTSSSDTPVENIVVTPTIDPSLANPSAETNSTPNPFTAAIFQSSKTTAAPKTQPKASPLSISIVDARSISSPAVTTTTNKQQRKRKAATVSKLLTEKKVQQPEINQFADINLPEVETYRQMYAQNLSIYNPNVPTITGITTINAAGIPQTFPMTPPFPLLQVQPSPVIGVPVSQVQNKPSEVIVPGESASNNEEDIPSKKQKLSDPPEKIPAKKNSTLEETNAIHNKIRDAISGDDDEDCDKPLASLIGHPIDSVLKKNIVDIVEQTDLQDITINGVIQKVYATYPKFDLSYRKEFIKSTVRSLLYKLGEQKNPNTKPVNRDTNSPDCSVTTTDIQDNSLDASENSMECG